MHNKPYCIFWNQGPEKYIIQKVTAPRTILSLEAFVPGVLTAISAQLEIFTRSFNDTKHPFNAIVVDSKLRVAEKVEEEGGSLPAHSSHIR
jgi:hypothetical protein